MEWKKIFFGKRKEAFDFSKNEAYYVRDVPANQFVFKYNMGILILQCLEAQPELTLLNGI